MYQYNQTRELCPAAAQTHTHPLTCAWMHIRNGIHTQTQLFKLLPGLTVEPLLKHHTAVFFIALGPWQGQYQIRLRWRDTVFTGNNLSDSSSTAPHTWSGSQQKGRKHIPPSRYSKGEKGKMLRKWIVKQDNHELIYCMYIPPLIFFCENNSFPHDLFIFSQKCLL